MALRLIIGQRDTTTTTTEAATADADALTFLTNVARSTKTDAETARARAAECRRAMRAQRCRQLADKTRQLVRQVERDLDLDATKLRTYALHLENVAERLEGRR